ncbi:hypothetical protein OVA14_12375 [Agrococcus sp. SL85]|uniref:hypothetical protein n=1 Tax=Agrococcus sp. SL85 TaxID=2995141 RepID=UPI00226D0BFD|nr:hypothetical protein [Agrococcus sp. SL85]WAC66068.1 hypothetical protein OVA14_12375 [Agrococcus sp. SL85]
MRSLAFVLGGVAAILAVATLLDTNLGASERTTAIMPVLALLAIAAAILSLRPGHPRTEADATALAEDAERTDR